MPVMLNLPRAVTVPFSGAGVLAHAVLNQFNGQVLRLHAGLNMVVDDVAQHPLLRKFIVDERIAAPMAPLVPISGSAVPVVHEPAPEPQNPTAAILATVNEPDADAKAVVRAQTDAKAAEDARQAALKDAEKPPTQASAAAKPAADSKTA